ncbi:hypothetical protein ACW5YJ_12285 [Staphylococcus sp. mip270_02]
MIISKKKYEKLNNDLVDAKAKAFDEIMKGELGAYYDKAKSFDEIVKAVNAPYVEYPEDWMVDVLKVVRNFEQGSAHDER